MRIKTIQDISNVKSWEELRRYASQILGSLVDVVNGNLDLVDNCSTSLVTVTFPSANTTVNANHTLGRIPQGYIVVGRSTAIHVFDGSGDSTSSYITLQASAAGSATLLIF